MSEEKLCPECGKPFGTNPDCIYCRLKIFEKEISGEPKKQTLEGLERLVEDGPKTIKPPQGPEARKKFEEWLKETVEWYKENEQWWRPLKEETEAMYKKSGQ